MASLAGLRADPWRAAWGGAWAWALAFPGLALGFRVNLFADGALFTYAVGVGDSWGHHWHNIAGRAAVWALVLRPAEWLGAWTGRVAVAEAAYVLLFYAWPLVSLAVVARAGAPGWVGRAAVLSHIGLLPFVFGFPTEMWVAHGAIWAALALMAAPGRAVAGWGFLLVACLSHEAGAVWAVAAVAALWLARLKVGRHGAALGGALAVWAAVRWGLPPDAYTAAVMAHNAGTFLRPGNVALPLALLAGAALMLAAVPRWGVWLGLAVALVPLLEGFPLHAWDRYHARTLLFAGVPGLMLLGAATVRWGFLPGRGMLLGAVAVLGVAHAAQTARFLGEWRGYLALVDAHLAAGAAEIDPRHPAQVALGWNSTTPFLAVLRTPGRVLVDPSVNYVWFDCATARRAAARDSAMPAASRAAIAGYVCARR